jgi:hypothetical protein
MMPAPSAEHLIISPRDFQWFVTLLTGGVAAYWIVVDSLRLRGALRDDTSRPSVKDRIFGSIVGLAIGVIGILGAYLGRP